MDLAMSRALARTLGEDVPPLSSVTEEGLGGYEGTFDVPERRGCQTCDGCRWLTSRNDRFTVTRYVEEPWHLYLQRSGWGKPERRRIGWRPCPACNVSGKLGYRDPFTGQSDERAA